MAFENVFGNVDFGLPVRQAEANRGHLMQMMGMGIQQAQQKEEMDMRRRQLAAKEGEINLKKMAEHALLKKNMGFPINEQESAAIQTMSQIAPPVYGTDSYGNTVARPSGWAGVSLGAAPPTGGYGQGSNPAISSGYGDIQPAMMDQGDVLAQVQGTQPQGGGVVEGAPGVDVESYKAPAFLGPRGKLMEAESDLKRSDALAIEKIKKQEKGLERFNDSNLTSANFANRMVESRNIMDDLMQKDPDSGEGMTGNLGMTKHVLDILPLGDFGSSLGAAAVHLGAEPEQQQYLNAAENWLTANLRKESGAVIGADEMAKEYRKYFPMPGDSGALKEQKKLLRGQAEKGMIGQSAGSYQEMFGAKSQAKTTKKFPPTAEGKTIRFKGKVGKVINGEFMPDE